MSQLCSPFFHCRRALIFAALPAFLAGAAPPRPCQAQNRLETLPQASSGAAAERKAAARSLFEEGLVHADARRWPEAADRFERARALLPTPEIAYNLSTALMGMGKLVRAAETLREITTDAQAVPRVKAAAETRLAEILPRLSHLTIRVPPRLLARGASVRIDGQPLDAARLDVPLPADPTAHRAEVHQGVRVIDAKDFVLGEGESLTVTFSDVDLTAVPVASAPAAMAGGGTDAVAAADGAPHVIQAATVHDAASPAKRRWWLWGALGIAVVGVSVAIVAVATSSDSAPNGNVGNWPLGPQ